MRPNAWTAQIANRRERFRGLFFPSFLKEFWGLPASFLPFFKLIQL